MFLPCIKLGDFSLSAHSVSCRSINKNKTTTMKTQLFLAFAAIVLLSLSSGEDSRVYCGRRLAQKLAMLCDYKYTEKKSASSYNAVDYDGFGWPWLRHHKARALASGRGKRGPGVATECCDKPCTVDELLSYC